LCVRERVDASELALHILVYELVKGMGNTRAINTRAIRLIDVQGTVA